MAVIKYDVSDVEAGGGGLEPPPGLYPGKIVDCTHRTKKADGATVNDLEVVVDIGSEYVRLWTYIKLPGDPAYDNSRWKLRELTDALGMPPKGGIDPAKIKGKEVMAKTKWRRDDPEKAELKNLFAPGAAEVSADDAEALASDASDDYSAWSKDDLLAEIEERQLDKPGGRVTEAKLIEIIEADDASKADEPNGGDDTADGTDELGPSNPGFYGDWSDQDLKDEITEQGLSLSGRFGRGKAIELLAGAAGATDDGAGSDSVGDDAAAPDEYDDFTDQELKDEITDREKDGAEITVTGRWTRDKAIAALREDDTKAPF